MNAQRRSSASARAGPDSPSRLPPSSISATIAAQRLIMALPPLADRRLRHRKTIAPRGSLRQLAHQRVQLGLPLEADARAVRQAGIAVLDRDVVGEAAERLEDARVGLVAAQA